MSTIPMIAAAVCGFVVRECQSVLPAIKEDENSPGKFSFGYYFARPRNLVLLIMNGAGATALVLGHSEVVGLLKNIDWIAPYVDGVTVPVLTGAAIGYCGAALFRWLAKFVG